MRERLLRMTDNGPVQSLQARSTGENIIDAWNKGAHGHDDNPQQIRSMPELFHLTRVGSHEVVSSAED